MPGPMGPGMMLTPGAMGPGMMTPGAVGPGMMTPGPMGPGMMGDVNLMVATMLLANDRIDAALAQAALSRVERPEISQFAEDDRPGTHRGERPSCKRGGSACTRVRR